MLENMLLLLLLLLLRSCRHTHTPGHHTTPPDQTRPDLGQEEPTHRALGAQTRSLSVAQTASSDVHPLAFTPLEAGLPEPGILGGGGASGGENLRTSW